MQLEFSGAFRFTIMNYDELLAGIEIFPPYNFKPNSLLMYYGRLFGNRFRYS